MHTFPKMSSVCNCINISILKESGCFQQQRFFFKQLPIFKTSSMSRTNRVEGSLHFPSYYNWNSWCILLRLPWLKTPVFFALINFTREGAKHLSDRHRRMKLPPYFTTKNSWRKNDTRKLSVKLSQKPEGTEIIPYWPLKFKDWVRTAQ